MRGKDFSFRPDQTVLITETRAHTHLHLSLTPVLACFTTCSTLATGTLAIGVHTADSKADSMMSPGGDSLSTQQPGRLAGQCGFH